MRWWAAALALTAALAACRLTPKQMEDSVTVITLDDGTRCVVLDTGTYAGGIDCDWGPGR